MKNRFALVVILFSITACNNSTERFYELSLKNNGAEPTAYDLYIKVEGASERFLKTINDVKKSADGSHFAIVDKGVFILKNLQNEANNTWRDELWYFTADKQVLLWSEQNAEIVFTLSPDRGQILMLSKNGKLILRQTSNPEEPFKELVLFEKNSNIDMAQFDTWASNGVEVWVSALKIVSSSVSTVPRAFFKVNVSDFKVTPFDVPHPWMNDVKINPYSEEVVYSDYPVQTDDASYSDALVSENYAKLYLYNFNTKESTVIDSLKMIDGLFDPVWLDDEVTLEYNGANGKGRIQTSFENYLQDENNSVDLVGAWHAAPSVGAGYSDRYLFKLDNTYLYFTSQSDETPGKVIVESGSWSMQGDQVVLNVQRRITNDDKSIAMSEERILTLEAAEEESPEASPYEVKRKINSVYFWQLGDGDVEAWQSEYNELEGTIGN